MNGPPWVQIGRTIRLPVDPFLTSVHLDRDSLPEKLRGRLFLTMTEAAKLLDVDPRTLRRSLGVDDQTALKAVDGGRAA